MKGCSMLGIARLSLNVLVVIFLLPLLLLSEGVLPFSSRIRNQVILKIYVLIL